MDRKDARGSARDIQSLACVHKDGDEQKSSIAEQCLFACKDARGSEGIFNPSIS